MKNALATLAAIAALSACAPSNPEKMAPPEVYGQSNQSAPVATKVAFQPEVDILFVIDNSDSMIQHQEDLKANINSFVAAFEANKRIDFHIGVTSVWDSRSFTSGTSNGKTIGQLYPVQNGASATDIGQFVTRTPDYGTVLGNTLKIGTISYKLGGPQYEELFSPVAAAIDGRNVGFMRPDAHLAVIMITDADDVSSIAPSKLATILSQAKQNDTSMYSTYAVIALTENASCKRDPGNRDKPNVQINEFLRQTKGHAYDLCGGHYGDKLADAGKQIAKQANKAVKIQLEQIPENGTLQVKIGGVDKTANCQYDPKHYTVLVPSSAMDGAAQDAQVEVTYVPVDVRRIGTPRTKSAL